jgi:hypothetical protein
MAEPVSTRRKGRCRGEELKVETGWELKAVVLAEGGSGPSAERWAIVGSSDDRLALVVLTHCSLPY